MKKLALFLGIFLQTVAVANPQQLQKAAQTFRDYCSGCHSLQYLTYERLAEDSGMKPGPQKGSILTALPEKDALAWFGIIPPDLSLKAREKGSDWLRHYLQGFYPDKNRPFGVNNHLLRNVAMPDVLASVSAEQYEQILTDLTIFLTYAAEPAQQIRYRMGLGVLAFLALLAGFAYALKKSCWKNIQDL